MKRDTTAAKLAKLLGLEEEHQKTVKKKKEKKGIFEGITEAEIQDFREAQGITYFLQAPALFQHKICKHCGESFLVSRLYVAYCSYTCIRKSLNELGIEWKKGKDIEALVADPEVYGGNEPIWIRNLPMLQKALQTLLDSQSTLVNRE